MRKRGASSRSSRNARARARRCSAGSGPPTGVRTRYATNPQGTLDSHFTDSTAWDFIAERIEAGEEVKVIELEKPPGAQGVVMRIDLGSDVPTLYVKLQLGAGKIIGRSFHNSKHE